MAITTDTITFPAGWASALVNGDYSGLEDDEGERCAAAETELADEGWIISDMVEDSERFTWNYGVYDRGAGCSGGDVADFLIFKN